MASASRTSAWDRFRESERVGQKRNEERPSSVSVRVFLVSLTCRFGDDPNAGLGSVCLGLAALAPAAAASARRESDAENEGARSSPPARSPEEAAADGRISIDVVVDAPAPRLLPPAVAVDRATSTGLTWNETAEGSALAESSSRLWLRTSSDARLTSRA